jgi:signal transduction histidine kinase
MLDWTGNVEDGRSPCDDDDRRAHPPEDDPEGQWRRPGPAAVQRRRDLYLALSMAAVAMLGVVLANSMGSFPLGRPRSWPEQLAWAVAVVLPLIWRRTRPELSTVVLAVLFIAAQARANPETLTSSAALFIAVYTLGAWGRNRRLAAQIRVSVIVAMFGWLAISATLTIMSTAPQFEGAAGPLPPILAVSISSVLFNLLFFLVAYLLGNSNWTAARRQHLLEVQAEALRRSRAANAERAVTHERVRIARELHDVVAHHVSVMGVQASACRRVLDKDPAKAKSALAAVEQSARTAVDELRRMLGVLRDAGATDGTTGYGLGQIEKLLQGARDAGLTVEFEAFGTPVPVPESVSLAGYRVVQEALTNTIKHARASGVDVRVRYLKREIEVEVTDDGRTAIAGGLPQVAPTYGLGLIGMRERVAAHDGSLEVGARTGGGFRVRARFPLGDPDISAGLLAAAPV